MYFWPEAEEHYEGDINWIDDSYDWWYAYYGIVNSLEDEATWADDSWTMEGEEDTWWTGDDTTWQASPTELLQLPPPQQAVSAVTTSSSQVFRPQLANSASQVGAVTQTTPTPGTSSHAQPLSGQSTTRTVSWIYAVIPCAELVITPLICGVYPNSGLRMILDSGATFHVCPLGFGEQFYWGNRQDTMDELPLLRTAHGSPLRLHGTRSVSLQLQNGATMNISFIVCDTQYPIVSVNRLREGGFTTCLGKENYIEKDGLKEHVLQESKLFWITPTGYGWQRTKAT